MARFLIVDDDPAVSEMFGRMLQRSGYALAEIEGYGGLVRCKPLAMTDPLDLAGQLIAGRAREVRP